MVLSLKRIENVLLCIFIYNLFLVLILNDIFLLQLSWKLTPWSLTIQQHERNILEIYVSKVRKIYFPVFCKISLKIYMYKYIQKDNFN